MLDIKFIRENVDKLKKTIVDKRIDLNLEDLLDVDQERRTLLAETEDLSAAKNAVSKELPKLSEEEKKVKLLEMKEVDAKQGDLKAKLRDVEKRFEDLMLLVPNIPAPETPIGKDDTQNVPWKYWSPTLGQVDPKDVEKVKTIPTAFTFPIKDHLALGTSLGILDTEAGVKTSGFRGYYLKNEAVLLQQALINLALDKLRKRGFTLMAPPMLVREFALVGSGHFPGGRDEIYQAASAGSVRSGKFAEEEAIYLAGTSEPSLLAYYADTILEEKDLPVKLAGVSNCFRSEIGSYGKDTKGVYRIHEFTKVEQVVLCKADINEADQWLENLREVAEEILQELKLPYRVIHVCTGDMGAGKYKMYDIETWMPSRNGYGETHSDSSLTDWQSRRLNIRYKDAAGKIKHVFTLNNTAIASPRILIPILENYQQQDGSVLVPEVLRKFVGVDVLKPNKPVSNETNTTENSQPNGEKNNTKT